MQKLLFTKLCYLEVFGDAKTDKKSKTFSINAISAIKDGTFVGTYMFRKYRESTVINFRRWGCCSEKTMPAES